jgi:6-phospho-3-hexuloisomerase
MGSKLPHILFPYCQVILKGIYEAIENLDPLKIESMVESLVAVRRSNRKLLVVGAGRSGLVGKAFAMRLMHLGFNVYVLGETITPSVGKEDLVLIISGSGSTTLPVTVANMSKKLGAKVLAITSYEDSPIGKTADFVITIQGREIFAREDEYSTRQLMGEHESLAPMGTMFEDSCMVFLDSIIAELMSRLKITEDSMKTKHATIE